LGNPNPHSAHIDNAMSIANALCGLRRSRNVINQKLSVGNSAPRRPREGYERANAATAAAFTDELKG
jgi:hypothetical protein